MTKPTRRTRLTLSTTRAPRQFYGSVLVAVVGLLAVMTACGSSNYVVTSVQITRSAGLLILPPVDQTITDSSTASRLASDILNLPAFPSGGMSCPVSFGTSYSLRFTGHNPDTWTALVEVLGCERITLSDGRLLWAIQSTRLFSDLGSALGLATYEVIPRPCVTPEDAHCYLQPPLPAS